MRSLRIEFAELRLRLAWRLLNVRAAVAHLRARLSGERIPRQTISVYGSSSIAGDGEAVDR